MSYLVLLLLIGGLGGAYLAWPAARIYLSVAIGVSYCLWGLFHHRRDRHFHSSVVLEYLSFGLLAMTLLIFLSLRV